MHRLLAIAIVAVLALAASACGSDAASDEPTTTISPQGEQTGADEPAATETTAAESAGGEEAEVATSNTTVIEPEESSTTVEDEPIDGEPGDVAEFCRRIEDADNATVDFESEDDPVAYEAFLVEAQLLYELALEVAPPDIESDLGLLVGYISEVIAAGDDLEWDEDAMNLFAEDLETPELTRAVEVFEEYTEVNCAS